MQDSALTGLINNAVLLLAIGVLYQVWVSERKTVTNHLISGFILGTIGIALMMSSWQLTSGVILDTRSILLSVGGLFFGGLATLISVTMTGVYRLYHGGAGAWSGVALIIVSGAIGVIWRSCRKRPVHLYSNLEFYLLGIAVHLCMLLLGLTFPGQVAMTFLKDHSLLIMIIFPFVTMLLGRLLATQSLQLSTQKALADSEKQYRSLIKEMTSPFALHEVLCQPDGTPSDYRYLEVNKAFEETTGLQAAELIGKTVRQVLPEIEPYWIDAFGQVATTGEPVSFSQYVSALDKYYEVSAYCPRPHQFAVVAKDITARKLAEKKLRISEEKYRALVEQSLTGIYILSADRFLYVNNRYAEIFGYSVDEILSSLKPTDILDPEERPRADKRIRERLSGEVESAHYIAKGKRKDNSPLWLEIYGTHIELEGEPLICGTMLDITSRIKAEDEIRQLNTTLEQRIEERTHELSEVNKELESFSYSISHDLQAPLRAMTGLSNILLEKSEARPDETTRYLRLIHDNGIQMGQLIDNLLNFSRTSRKKLSKTDIDMEQLVKQCIEDLADNSTGREIDFQIQTLPGGHGDPSLLKQVMLNLLSNAIKYSRKREIARIEIGSLEQGSQTAYFVRDNGVGFNMRYQDKLFGVFQRLHSADEFEGTGVGLALAKRIIQRHGGNIWADSEVNKGSIFYFTLGKA